MSIERLGNSASSSSFIFINRQSSARTPICQGGLLLEKCSSVRFDPIVLRRLAGYNNSGDKSCSFNGNDEKPTGVTATWSTQVLIGIVEGERLFTL